MHRCISQRGYSQPCRDWSGRIAQISARRSARLQSTHYAGTVALLDRGPAFAVASVDSGSCTCRMRIRDAALVAAPPLNPLCRTQCDFRWMTERRTALQHRWTVTPILTRSHYVIINPSVDASTAYAACLVDLDRSTVLQRNMINRAF
ncbi:hypothetical protein HN011_011757 [Eciton burchellii]|nr:hypothetical protein HN011_011757 [Eciton burchellii]